MLYADPLSLLTFIHTENKVNAPSTINSLGLTVMSLVHAVTAYELGNAGSGFNLFWGNVSMNEAGFHNIDTVHM